MYFVTSTLAMSTALRHSLMAMQTDVTRSRQELVTGRHADMADSLGLALRRTISLGGARQMTQAIIDSNQLVSARLDTTQTALAALSRGAQTMRQTLIAAANDGGDRQAIATQAMAALGNLISTLNNGDGSSFVFGGVNSGQPPINDYFANPPSPNKAAFDAAFVTAFGFSQNSPAVASITPAQMQSFLSGPMASLFDASGWSANWSHASDQPLRSQIGVGQTIDTSLTANDPAMRKLAMAYAAMSDLGAANMSADTFKTLLQSATQTIDASVGLLTKAQATVGVMQSAVSTSNDRMSIQISLLQSQIADLESVDPTEAATRVNSLTTQIETSYALTARIAQLSLTKYL